MNGIVMSAAHLGPIMVHIIRRESFFSSTVINLLVEQNIQTEL